MVELLAEPYLRCACPQGGEALKQQPQRKRVQRALLLDNAPFFAEDVVTIRSKGEP